MASIAFPGTIEIVDWKKRRESRTQNTENGNLNQDDFEKLIQFSFVLINPLLFCFFFVFFKLLYILNFENCLVIDSFAITTVLTKDYHCVNSFFPHLHFVLLNPAIPSFYMSDPHVEWNRECKNVDNHANIERACQHVSGWSWSAGPWQLIFFDAFSNLYKRVRSLLLLL